MRRISIKQLAVASSSTVIDVKLVDCTNELSPRRLKVERSWGDHRDQHRCAVNAHPAKIAQISRYRARIALYYIAHNF